MALRTGKRVIAIPPPDSQMGEITPEFAQAVEQSGGFEPYVEFYKAVYLAFLNRNSIQRSDDNAATSLPEAELWGHSTGDEIIFRLLQDPEVQERTTNAVCIAPACSANMSHNKLMFGGTLGEALGLLKGKLPRIPRYTLTSGRSQSVPQEEAGQRELKKRVFNELLKKIRTNFESWKNARVKGDGHILVVSGTKDKFTRSYETFRDDPSTLARLQQENPQLNVVSMPGGFHMSVHLEPENYIARILEAQQKETSVATNTQEPVHISESKQR